MEENKNGTPVRNTPIARTGAMNNPDNASGDIFSAVYREKKIQNEQEKIEAQRIAAQQAAQAQQITSVSAIPANDANDKKFKPVFIILIIITIASVIIARIQFAEQLLTADGANPKPIAIIIGPVTIGGKYFMIFFAENILISAAITM